MRHTSHIRVDLNAIASNLRTLRAVVGAQSEVCAVVKADAYGLGGKRVTRALVGAGARRLAVFTLDQAAELEEVAPNARILVLMPVDDFPLDSAISRLLASGRVELVAVDHEQVAALARIRVGRPLRVHVEVDCGIGRSGVDPRGVVPLVEDVHACRSLQLVGLFTHFSTHECDRVREQATIFDRVIEELGPRLPAHTLVHAASSGPCFSAPEQRRSMVRIGLGWAGWLPCDQDDPQAAMAQDVGLRGAVTWASSIIQVRKITAGTSVGYGSEWMAKKDTRIGLVAVGYSDGYPATLADPANPHRVLVQTRAGLRSAPVLGAVNMDQLVLDLGTFDSCEHLDGCEVLLLSDQHDSSASLHAVANRAGITGHQLLACLGKNVPRIYLADVPNQRCPRESEPLLASELPSEGTSVAAG